ncbi:FxSxx-COOH system tetratricopeptide repeat protein [Streptomyces sp. NBC_00690]|uniref:FxSxx-COOH system tetratricopeptide repeat protein n=1 Tax=Streptomyces sp. NBC_00690 TaxID=2975808 RepID=UPI002E2E74CF|nr:FxSxx-COOH system tetratricopeptide repeat protein [Streptomyces sp. NBC_00690]
MSILSDAGRDNGRTRVTLFCSTAENIGQTTTVVNVALVMAESGRRVLIVDTRQSDIRAFHYLGSLSAGTPNSDPDSTRSSGAALPPPSIWDVSLHNRTLRVDLLTLDDVPALTRLDPSVLLRYDEVLIDAPVPRHDEEYTVLAGLPHVLATCFPLNSWRVENAAALARRVRQRAVGQIGVLAIGLRADSRMYDQLRTARALVRENFEELSDGAGAHYVEFPYESLYAQLDRLAVQEEDPGSDGGLRPRFVQLADELARTQPVELSRVTLLHTPRHIAWAEWIAGQLESCGVEVSRSGFDPFIGEPPLPGAMLLVVSPLGVESSKAELLADLSHPDVRMVLVDEEVLPRELSHHEQIVMRHVSEAEAVIALRESLHLPGPALSESVHRFPRMPRDNNLWPRNNAFIGRDALFEEVRETLAAAAVSRSCGLLLGQPGIGKSQIALEFCHRFRGDYDLVWWVPGDGPASVRRGLTSLAERLGLPTVGDPVPRVLAHLGSPGSGDWLLVYDDVRDAAALSAQNLIPTSRGGGHVLITARLGDQVASGHVVEVAPFSAEESRALLASAVDQLPSHLSEQIGQTVGHLPLTVALAAAWLDMDAARHEAENRSRNEAVLRAAERFDQAFATAQTDLLAHERKVPLPRVVLEVAVRSIGLTDAAQAWAQEHGGATALGWVLECCALLTGAGADLALLRSPQMLWALAHRTGGAVGPPEPAAMVSDELMVDVALWALSGLGLIEVDFARPGRPVRMHQVLREAVLTRMGDTERKVRERELRAVVGGYSPGATAAQDAGPAVGTNGGQGGERQLSASQTGQLTALRIWEDQRPPVQRWLLDHLGVLTRSDDVLRLAEALELGRRAESAWANSPNSAEYLRLQTLLARALRNSSEYPGASRHARVALRGYRASFGTHHPRTLLCADAYGAILRADGHFTDALFEGRHVHRGLLALLGPQHRATDQVEHNLALSEALAGDAPSALQLLQDQFNRRRAIGGPDDPRAWQIANTLAGTHRALGQNRESSTLLREFLAYRSAMAPSSAPDADVLRAENGLAVGERRFGRTGRAHERDGRVLADCLRYLGEWHIVTLRTRYSLAIDLYELGKHEAALQESAICLQALGHTLGADHPYTQLCRVRHGVHLRGSGRPDEALEEGRTALEQLEARLGSTHPWKLAAASSLAGTLAARGEFEEAADLEESTLEGFDELGLTQHPYRELVARNLSDLLAVVSGESRAGDALRGDIDLELPGAV